MQQSKSFTMAPRASKPRGSALLLHGLTGSPAEMMGLGEYLREHGWYVQAPCLIGHGTSSRELGMVRLNQWRQQVRQELHSSFVPPLAVCGFSFGSLLALDLVQESPDAIQSVALISPPYLLRSWCTQLLFQGLSSLPELVLDRLGSVPKSARSASCLELPHIAYREYSLGAIARLHQLRKYLLPKLSNIQKPILICQDPEDHLLSPHSASALTKRLCRSKVQELILPGGQHELLLGRLRHCVYKAIEVFLTDN